MVSVNILDIATPTRVLLVRVEMEETARMVSMDLPVHVLQDTLELIVVST